MFAIASTPPAYNSDLDLVANLPKKYKWEQLHERIDTLVENLSVENISGGVGYVSIPLSARKTIVYLGYINSADVQTVNIRITNPGKQYLGDQIVLVSQPDTFSNDITYSYEPTQFYLTR